MYQGLKETNNDDNLQSKFKKKKVMTVNSDDPDYDF